MKRYILFVVIIVIAGCADQVVRNEALNWVSSGTLVSVGPDVESSSRPGRLESAILGDTKLNSTRVETTKGVYIISEKISVIEPGAPVSVGYNTADKNFDTPLYLNVKGQRYKIVR